MKVSQERWEQAQQAELALWERSDQARSCLGKLRARARDMLVRVRLRRPSWGDDWNWWWANKFDDYEMIPKELNNVVEFGCGPYTNARIILQGRVVRHLHCSDPLGRRYIKLRRSWLAYAYKSGHILLDDHPAEEAPFASDYFDLTMLINVLDHVRDASLCLEQAIRVTRPSGLLIVGQDLTNENDMAAGSGDVLHPITLTASELDEMLLRRFERELYRILPRSEGRDPEMHYGTYLFVGRKTERDTQLV